MSKLIARGIAPKSILRKPKSRLRETGLTKAGLQGGEEIMPNRNNDQEKAKIVYEGLVLRAFPNGMFRVCVDDVDNENPNTILGYISGKIRLSSTRIEPGDRVKIEVSSYDLTKGRIIFRFPRDEDDNKVPN